MTEYELIDLLNSTITVIGMNISIYLTLVSAYLITAYSRGKLLSKSQLIVISIIFLAAVEYHIAGVYIGTLRAAYVSNQLTLLIPEYPQSFPKAAAVYILVLLQFGVIASYKFMFDVRRED